MSLGLDWFVARARARGTARATARATATAGWEEFYIPTHRIERDGWGTHGCCLGWRIQKQIPFGDDNKRTDNGKKQTTAKR
jgi:hypothetical protein